MMDAKFKTLWPSIPPTMLEDYEGRKCPNFLNEPCLFVLNIAFLFDKT